MLGSASGPGDADHRQRLRRTADLAGKIGCLPALGVESAFDSEELSSEFLEALTDEKRAAVQVLLPIRCKGRVLVAGCDPAISLAFGRWSREVVSFDPSPERTRLTALRARELRLRNVQCTGDDRRLPLPFPDATFDGVVLDPRLGGAWKDEAVLEVLQRLVGEARRVLRRHGHLFVWGVNPLTTGFLLGSRGGARPAAWKLLLRGVDGLLRRPKSDVGLGRGAWLRLLRVAGFERTHVYALVPHSKQLEGIVSLDPRDRPRGRAGGGARDWVRRRLQTSRWLCPSYGIVASAGILEKSWLHELCDHLRVTLGDEEIRALPEIHVSRRIGTSGLVLLVGCRWVVRVPLNPASKVSVQRNFEGLRMARDLLGGRVAAQTPEPVLEGELAGVYFTVESRLPGRRLSGIPERSRGPSEEAAIEALFSMLRLEGGPRGEVDPQEHWRTEVVEPILGFWKWVSDEETESELRRLLSHLEGCGPDGMPLGLSHGDYQLGNLTADVAGGGVGIFDWDRWTSWDYPTQDFLHFILHRRSLRAGTDYSAAFRDWLAGRGVDQWEARWTERFERTTGVPPTWRLVGALAFWAYLVASYVGTPVDQNEAWKEKNFKRLLPEVTRMVRAAG